MARKNCVAKEHHYMARKEIPVTPERPSLHETAEHYAWEAMTVFGIDGNNSVPSKAKRDIEGQPAASDIPTHVQRHDVGSRSLLQLGRPPVGVYERYSTHINTVNFKWQPKSYIKAGVGICGCQSLEKQPSSLLHFCQCQVSTFTYTLSNQHLDLLRDGELMLVRCH